MIPVTTFAGKTVAVFGLGKSGLLSARALKEGGADVVVFDDNDKSVAEAQPPASRRRTCATSTGRGSPRWCWRRACRSPIPSRTGR